MPRAAATTEEVGPFTLFLADGGHRLAVLRPAAARGDATFTADDVRRVLARQVELGRPRAIEWVDEVTPSPVARGVVEAGHEAGRYPLLALPAGHRGRRRPSARGRSPPTTPISGWPWARSQAAFDGDDEVTDEAGRRATRADRRRAPDRGRGVRRRRAAGRRRLGRTARRDRGADGDRRTPGASRGTGVGTAITQALVHACRDAGVRTVFLSAYNDAAASIYRRVGFEDVGTACILGVDDE